jgi:hypothetical protein
VLDTIEISSPGFGDRARIVEISFIKLFYVGGIPPE